MPLPINQNWYIIANPAAGNGVVGQKLPKIKKLLSGSKIAFQLVETKKTGDAISLACDGIEKGFRKIMTIGGDGTNNEVINGIMLQKHIKTNEVLYSLLPVGTGNDWIKTHGIPKDLKLCLELIKKEKTTLQDIGLVSYFKNGQPHKRYFANVAGMAYDAYLVKHTIDRKGRINNKFFYLILLLKYLFKYKPQQASIHFNDQVITDYFYTINAGICRFAGGGMEIVPHAISNDGNIALTIIRKLSKLRVLLNTYRFYNGSIARIAEVSTHLSKKIRIESLEAEPILVEADGEYLGETPVEFGIFEKALRVLVP